MSVIPFTDRELRRAWRDLSTLADSDAETRRGNSHRLLLFFTWLDVERRLKQCSALWSKLPETIQGVDCFSDGMEVRRSGEDHEVDTWLGSIFGHAYRPETSSIRLRIGTTDYPVELVQDDDQGSRPIGQPYPLWQDMTYLPAGEDEQAVPSSPINAAEPAQWTTGPTLASFHSFKGGVGRTTALMTYVAACLQAPGSGTRKILIVDADLEAPGVSFWLDEDNRPSVSFVQLLEALHYPPLDVETTLDFFSDELRKTSLSVSGMQRELFVLPAALDLSGIQDMRVTPEHLARHPENPWQLSDHLHALGRRLEADAVFVDLRAGLSELASPILFDPRVDHFFVTTVASQSILGTREVLKRLNAFNRGLPAERQGAARPTVLLNMLTRELRESSHYEQALSSLNEAYPPVDPLSIGIQWLEAEFMNPLMAISSVRRALEVLPQASALFASACEWADALYATPGTDAGATDIAHATRLRARELQRVCEQAQFAESDTDPEILVTEPLLNLGKHFAKELPNLLIIGAKGAGKTFTYRALVRSRSWPSFLKRLGFEAAQVVDASVFPLLWSSNIEDRPEGEIKMAQRQVLDLVGGSYESLLRQSDLDDAIREALDNPPASWERFWDGLIARQAGVEEGGLDALNDLCERQQARVIFVFDGVEDAFQDPSEANAAAAIHALLRLPNRMSELGNRQIGAIVLVRADYVQATVRQNVAQLLQRFQPFRLHWNPESFLRLARMLSCKAGVIPDAADDTDAMTIERLKEKLEMLWGKKLGNERSKEAHSARWVYAALCDLNGNVQARDLVRFLKLAAELESERVDTIWPDRALSPESMRKAIPLCSIEKVSEVKQEIAPLRKWIALLDEKGVRNLEVPFSQVAAHLNSELLKSLQEIGVLYEDLDGDLGEQRLFLPEIYRHGMAWAL